MAVRAAWLAICSLFHLCACIGKQPACTLPVQKSWAVHEGTEPYCTQSCQVGESGPKVFSAISSSWLSTNLVWELLTTQDVHSWMDACLPFCLSSCSLRNHCLCFILFFFPCKLWCYFNHWRIWGICRKQTKPDTQFNALIPFVPVIWSQYHSWCAHMEGNLRCYQVMKMHKPGAFSTWWKNYNSNLYRTYYYLFIYLFIYFFTKGQTNV